MHLLLNGLFFVVGIVWRDWKNWKKYYPTYLFFLSGDLFTNALLHNYRMWEYREGFFGKKLLVGHFGVSLLIMLIFYSSTVVIYLGHFPNKLSRIVLWIAGWVCFYTGIEWINLHFLHLIMHHHGWTIQWSMAFNLFIFVVLRIHFKNPILAWGLSLFWILFLLNNFHLPNSVLK